MKKLARISSFLLTKELATQLKLQNQYYVVLIPKRFFPLIPTFDLIYENEKLSLISIPEVETTAPPAKETAT